MKLLDELPKTTKRRTSQYGVLIDEFLASGASYALVDDFPEKLRKSVHTAISSQIKQRPDLPVKTVLRNGEPYLVRTCEVNSGAV